MRLSVRTRVVLWLVCVLLPVLAASTIALILVDDRLSERSESDLANTARLEAIRIENALDRYERAAESLAAGANVRQFTAAVVTARSGQPSDLPLGGVDGFQTIDPRAERPLDELSDRLLGKTSATGSQVLGVALIDPSGAVLGQTATIRRAPQAAVVAAALTSDQPRYGRAFPAADGDHRLPLIVPVHWGPSAVGALMLETRLGPIAGPLIAHEGFAASSEAHLTQPRPDGGAEFITPLRFDPEAAFGRAVPRGVDAPAVWALTSPSVRLVRAPDYRGVDSILAVQSIPRTGWGLIVKIDEDEALAAVSELRALLVLSAVVALVIIVVGWLLLLNPLASRMRRMARAAQRVTRGDLTVRIGDVGRDELGATAASIDRLAAELSADEEAREKAEFELLAKARHDQLTGIANRQWATERLAAMFGESAVVPVSSLLFIDLDDFKVVNDTCGHDAGDDLLRDVAQRLTGLDAEGALVARWGGDEFLVALPGRDAPQAEAVADQIMELLAEPFPLRGNQVPVRASIGVATGGPDTTVDSCLRAADMAMFADKLTGGAMTPNEKRPGRRLVHDALSASREQVWYQPLVRLNETGEAVTFGAEALVRIVDENGELVSPLAFLEDVESTELGVSLDRRVIDLAIADLRSWERDGVIDDDFHLALNLSPASTRDPGIAAYIGDVCLANEVSPSRLVVELSERSTEVAAGTVDALCDLGVNIAVDDFGLKHSNVDRVRDCRATIAKIDRRWIADADRSLDGHDLLASMVQLCHALDMEIVAEGVEEDSQVEMLRALGIRRFQGYHFARPVPAEKAARSFIRPREPALPR